MIPKEYEEIRDQGQRQIRLRKKLELFYSEDPFYTDEEVAARIKIPERTFYRYKSQLVSNM
jgi:hypothetical protein